LELKIPEEVSLKLSREEVEFEVPSEVIKNSFESSRMLFEKTLQRSMKELEIFMEGVQQTMKDPGIFLSEG